MKTYLVQEKELRKFKSRFPTLTPANTVGTEFIVKAWISSLSDDGKTLKVIVSDERPTILFSEPAQIPLEPRTVEPDEQEAESRKDTLWGDLKLLTKKVVREGKHHVEHYQECRAQSIVAPTNLRIALRDSGLGSVLTLGDAYYFRLLPEPVGFLGRGGIEEIVASALSHFDSLTPTIQSDSVSQELPVKVNGGFEDFLAERIRRKRLKLAVIACLIIPSCVYVGRQVSVFERERLGRESETDRGRSETSIKGE